MIIKYLTVKEIIEIHDEILQFGGSKGVANEGAISLIVDLATERFSVIGEESVIKKASLLLYELTARHPFIDGNKRTAFVTCKIFLGANGYGLSYTVDEAEKLALGVAAGIKSRNYAEKWISKHAKLGGKTP
jgi:death-on-curing protein